MQAYQRRLDLVMAQKIAGSTRVFRRYDINFAQDSQRAEGNVLEVADRRRNDKEGSGHGRIFNVALKDRPCARALAGLARA